MNTVSFRFEAIGTQWEVEVCSPLTTPALADLQHVIRKRIEAYDQTYSRFRPDSLVTKISHQSGDYQFPADAAELFALYSDMYRLTRGKFTPLIGQVMEDAGYDAAYSFIEQPVIRQPQQWEQVMQYAVGELHVKEPVLLDFGAAGKGHIIDIIGQLLEQHDIRAYTIDGSGDLLYKTDTQIPLRVGLEHPNNPTQVIGIAQLQQGSLCASATQRRSWGSFHHIINPVTLRPAQRAIATWVVAETALVADGIATVLFLEDAAVLGRRYDFEYILLRDDYSLEKSGHFPGEMFVGSSL